MTHRKLLRAHRAHHETNREQKKACGICSASRFALENSAVTFRWPVVHCGGGGAWLRITWCIVGHLSHPQTCPSPRPSPCRRIVGTAMTALVCVCLCLRGRYAVCLCVCLQKWLRTGGKVGHVCLLFSEAETFDQLFPSEDNDESAPFHPPLFGYFYGLFFNLSVVCYYLPFFLSFHLLNSFGCSLSVLKQVCMDLNKSFTWLEHFL